ncbi:MAG: hypothetical protein CR997_03035 [Acidobacteria bacterium]|nr:MAG: hypothetical protein CR997_03035 [Acidobacteriota bacterium]
MKRIWIVTLGIAALLAAAASPYFYKIHTIRSVMKENIHIMETYIEAMKRASDPEAMASATHQYAADIRAFGGALKKVKSQYPQLTDPNHPPYFLKGVTAEYEEKVKLLTIASGKTRRFSENPIIAEANEDLIQAWIDTR